MAVISELVRAIAEVEGRDEVSVGVFARAAREAGLITHHGRGRNAAKMTEKDAANLLIAVNASSLAKNVPDVINSFRTMPVSGFVYMRPPLEVLTRDDTTFGESLEQVLRWCRVGSDGDCELASFLRESQSDRDHSRAKKMGVELKPARFVVKFEYPEHFASMAFVHEVPEKEGRTITWWSHEGMPVRYGHSTYDHLREDLPDRRDSTSITHRTLMHVARTLQN